MDQQLGWHKYPSHAKHGILRSDVPFTDYEVTAAGGKPSDPRGFLISEGNPFFSDFGTAVCTLLYDVADQSRVSQLPRQVMDILVGHTAAWIERVHFTASSVTVEIAGQDALGARLQIAGELIAPFEIEVQGGVVECLLPHGIPPRLWIVLSRGEVWLDYRNLAQGQYFQKPQFENVTIERDLLTRIEELIYRGEGETIEFKREIPPSHDKLLKTVAAFANGQGGTILLGVDKDEDKTVVGVTEQVNALRDRITNMIRDNLVPEPRIRLDDVQVDGKCVIAIEVEKGDTPPYGLHADKPIFSVRWGATTFVAKQDEIRALVQGKSSDNSRWGPSAL